MKNVILLCTCFLIFISSLWAEDSSKPGVIFKEISTLHCLGVRWTIHGDANENAVVDIYYKVKGSKEWRKGFPLFRTHPNPHSSNQSKIHTIKGGWMFAGSIVGLVPDTEYEIKLNLNDPDGGKKEELLTLKTWKEPVEPKDIKKIYVMPGNGGGDGSKGSPFKGLQAALPKAQPGTLFLLHKGVYVKGDCPENTLTLKTSGIEGKPIVFRALGDGEVILDGGGSDSTKGRLISAENIKHVWFEDFTIQGRMYAIVAHGGSNWVIRRCKFIKVNKGFTAHNGGYNDSQHHFISDNSIKGPTHWPRKKGIESYCLTYMSGSGHVIAFNKMSNVGDGMHGTGYGNLSASDYYRNDINVATDDGLETDYGQFNVRVFENRMRNIIHGITAQPSHGGPIYIFRNLIYNTPLSPFKLNNHTTGVLIFHNTCLRQGDGFRIVPANETVTNIITRNNLFLGTSSYGLKTTGRMRRCNFDNDGYGGFKSFASWNGQKIKTIVAAKTATYKNRNKFYNQKGAFLINTATCFESGMLPPKNNKHEYTLKELNFSLAKKSDAVDKGVILPGFNDNFHGKAPDLGAIELGQKPLHYGPRKTTDK
ncbi:MAG: hypothetical protein COA79_18735 [Planctomycetota bacterium]|nr:MAG: hypothetical protein COA79_18735 [Planctomycetota bacterium]